MPQSVRNKIQKCNLWGGGVLELYERFDLILTHWSPINCILMHRMMRSRWFLQDCYTKEDFIVFIDCTSKARKLASFGRMCSNKSLN